MKNGQKLTAAEAKQIIEKYGVTFVVDNGAEVTDFVVENIESTDTFTLCANYPNDAFLMLDTEDESDKFGIYVGSQGVFDGADWVLR